VSSKNSEKREKIFIKLAEFLFTVDSTVQSLMEKKIFDKVIDGIEYRLIKYRHFIRIIKMKGLCLSYNDEQSIKDLIPEIFPGCININAIENLLK